MEILSATSAGNKRAGGAVNPEYKSTFVFTNDFPALLPDRADPAALPRQADSPTADPLFQQEETIEHPVICFSPRHNLTLAQLAVGRSARRLSLGNGNSYARRLYQWVQVFENKGRSRDA
jgi:UDPglucose--hexose-1-phosphate uridylyltransferase